MGAVPERTQPTDEGASPSNAVGNAITSAFVGATLLMAFWIVLENDEAFLLDDRPAEFRVPRLEQVGDVLEVRKEVVLDDDRPLPSARDRVLGHRRSLVLRDVSEGERQSSLWTSASGPADPCRCTERG